MFNNDTETNISLANMALIVPVIMATDPWDFVITGIARSGDDYCVYLSCGQHGYTRKFHIENGEVSDHGRDGFWMS